jgi:hypothetical protein
MRFTTAVGFSVHGLDEAVNDLVQRGFEPWGGVCATWTPGGVHFYVLMVRK